MSDPRPGETPVPPQPGTPPPPQHDPANPVHDEPEKEEEPAHGPAA